MMLGRRGDWTWGGLSGLRCAAGCIGGIPEGGSAAGPGSDHRAGAFCGCAGFGDSGSRASGGQCVKEAPCTTTSPEPRTLSSLLVREAGGGAGASVWLWLKKEFSLYVRL